MENQPNHRINRYLFLAVIMVFALALLFSLKEFFTAFLGAIIFYVLSKKPANWLISKKKWSKALTATLVIVVSFFIFLIPVILFGAMLIKKVQVFGNDMGNIYATLRRLDEAIQQQFHIRLLSEDNLQQVQHFFNQLLSSALSGGLNMLASITMMYFFLFFMLVNINRLEAAILHYLPFSRRKILIFGEELQAQTFSNAVGMPLVAFGQGFTAYIAYLICNVPDAGFWAILTGATSVLPIIGTGLFWIPIAAYLVMQEQTWQAIFLAVWGVLVMGTIDNVIRFILAKKMANVHPLVTVLGIIIGLQNFGITGLVFGPLIISYFIILLKMYYSDYFAHPARPTHQEEATFSWPFQGIMRKGAHKVTYRKKNLNG
ncbi:MAG: AI-2E family transporter [Sediminibacterium sp.]|jgi:predicted PurR-regulated permease PerM|nr:AI-2E family transporter [Chitinophagaceae bacterium]MCE2973399.1 AI-2E family transporter [Sediminibacterium sp.]MCA6470691.1 AI-2E family transporter [Chitinophagaceae bacterium]MCA6473488.1 AI-2E family transporter [Chitinophagaceae bacterium]MCA6478056.1 AI-2E family transporter [Chitinophagaceae bacterium]